MPNSEIKLATNSKPAKTAVKDSAAKGIQTDSKQEAVKQERGSITTLFEHIKPGGDLISLLNFVRDSKRKMDAVIASYRDKVHKLKEQDSSKKLVDVSMLDSKQELSNKESLVVSKKEHGTDKHSDKTNIDKTNHDSVENLEANNANDFKKHVDKDNKDTPNNKEFLVNKDHKPTTNPNLDTNKTITPKTSISPKQDIAPVQPKTTMPSYIRGSFTPLVAPKATGTITRERDFRTGNAGSKLPYNKTNASNKQPFVRSGTGFNNNAQRPFAQKPNFNQTIRPSRPSLGGRPAALDVVAKQVDRSKVFDKKKEHSKTESANKSSKRTLMRMGILSMSVDEDRMGTRKLKNKKSKEQPKFSPIKIEKAVITTENLTVKILSEKIGKSAQEILKLLMTLGVMCNINSVVDYATMELVASELGVVLEKKIDKTKEEVLTEFHDNTLDVDEHLEKRPPVVAVMGHVDHGKTSLLDTIRKSSVALSEAGGITQHIGAYSVAIKDESITFLDTPGHEAFAMMRQRGARVTDIAILVVAADDGVMPQTIEAIKFIKAANVPMIVAINKMDKPGANPKKIKEKLTEYGVLVEDWGGDVMSVPISAKKNEGIDKLLDSILLLAEYQSFKANPKRSARGSILEAKLDKGKGPVATIIVQNGTLKIGDIVVSGMTYGKIRAMTDFLGQSVKVATPSMAVSVLGFNAVPNAGDGIFVVANEKLAKQVIGERSDKFKVEKASISQKVTFDDVVDKIGKSQLKELKVVIKADTQGSAEALRQSLIHLSNDEIKVEVVLSGVGNINKSDLMLAEASSAVVVGFNVKPDADSKSTAEKLGIEIKLHNIIYRAIEDLERIMRGMEKPVYRDIILGRAQIRNVFKLSSNGVIAGSYVLSGKVVRNAHARIFRGTDIVFEGKINSLKRFKEDVKEVGVNYECGISIDGYDAYVVNDEIEIYDKEQVNKV